MRGIAGRVSASVIAIVLATAAGFAADLPRREPAPPPVPIFTWTGFYVGAYGGGSFGGKSTSEGVGGRIEEQPSGVVAGGLAGYDFQFDRVVLGVEGDAGYSDASGSTAVSAPAGNGLVPAGTPASLSDKSRFVGRLRGRVGIAAANFGIGETLLFAAGGASFLSDTETFAAGVGGGSASASKTLSGFNIGAGLEVAVTPSILARAEYVYDDFGKDGYGLSSSGVVVQNRSVKINDSTMRGALEYKF